MGERLIDTLTNLDNSNETVNIGTNESGVAVSIGHTTSVTTVNDNLNVIGDLSVTSETTLTGAVTAVGTLAVTGALSAPILKAPVENGDTNLTIDEDLHAGTVIIQTDVSSNRTYNLPAPSAAGVIYRFLGQGSGTAADGHSIIITTGTAGVFFDGMITMLMTTTNDNSDDLVDNQFNTPVWADGTTNDHLQINVPAGYDITLIAKSTTVYYITGTVTSATAAEFTAP